MIIFSLKPHSVVDVITNSSAELFVGKSQSKEIMEELIRSLYPEYQSEYRRVKSIDEMSVRELNTFFSYATYPDIYPPRKSSYPVLPGFTFDELFEIEEREHENYPTTYHLKNNDTTAKKPWHRRFITEDNVEEMKNKLDPKREMFFLFSIDENPDWDMQEKLESIMTRYHLG